MCYQWTFDLTLRLRTCAPLSHVHSTTHYNITHSVGPGGVLNTRRAMCRAGRKITKMVCPACVCSPKTCFFHCSVQNYIVKYCHTLKYYRVVPVRILCSYLSATRYTICSNTTCGFAISKFLNVLKPNSVGGYDNYYSLHYNNLPCDRENWVHSITELRPSSLGTLNVF